MKFTKEQLVEKLDDYDDHVVNEICDTTRWSNIYSFIFKHEGKMYITSYSVGATESQDEGPWEFCHDDEEIECDEVEAYQKTITDYRKVK